jgi:hypothetical protein
MLLIGESTLFTRPKIPDHYSVLRTPDSPAGPGGIRNVKIDGHYRATIPAGISNFQRRPPQGR